MLRKLALTAAAFSAPGLALTIASERILRPRLFYAGPWHPDPPDPVGWPYEEARIFTADGLELQGWFFPRPDPSPTILFMHGTSYNTSDMWLTEERAQAFYGFLAGIKCNFLVFDYRGFGPNPGAATEEGTYTDAAAALAWLYARPTIDPGAIFYYGFSLGTGIAAGLALREPPRGLILRAPFTSVRDIATGRYPKLKAALVLAPWLPLTNYDTLRKIRRYHGPLLVMHGDADTTIPESMGQHVFEAAPGPKRYVAFPNSGHSDISPHLVIPPITQFIDDVLSGTIHADENGPEANRVEQ
jgi:pimeloyl-ACP methyl ester carboxylesterase